MIDWSLFKDNFGNLHVFSQFTQKKWRKRKLKQIILLEIRIENKDICIYPKGLVVVVNFYDTIYVHCLFILLQSDTDMHDMIWPQVVSQGTIVNTGQISGSEFSLSVTQEMCPEAQVSVYMVVGQAEPEIVLDSKTVTPSGCFDKEVSLRLLLLVDALTRRWV